jgi:hypothetical protein
MRDCRDPNCDNLSPWTHYPRDTAEYPGSLWDRTHGYMIICYGEQFRAYLNGWIDEEDYIAEGTLAECQRACNQHASEEDIHAEYPDTYLSCDCDTCKIKSGRA